MLWGKVRLCGMVDGAVHKQNFYSIFCSLEQVHLVQLDGVSIEISLKKKKVVLEGLRKLCFSLPLPGRYNILFLEFAAGYTVGSVC